jgi:hypothetical protein
MVIVMDMQTGAVDKEASSPCYDDEVLLSGYAEVPPDLPRVMPRLATVAEAAAVDEQEFMRRMYSAQGLPGRR